MHTHDKKRRTPKTTDLRALLVQIMEGVQDLQDKVIPASPLLTRKEAAEYLRLSMRTLDDMEAAGEIQAVRIRGRVLYHQDTLKAYVRRRSND